MDKCGYGEDAWGSGQGLVARLLKA